MRALSLRFDLSDFRCAVAQQHAQLVRQDFKAAHVAPTGNRLLGTKFVPQIDDVATLLPETGEDRTVDASNLATPRARQP